MPTATTRAKRMLREYGRNGGNWRLQGLFAAGLDTTKVTPKHMAKAWPINKSDYRFLGDDVREHRSYRPEYEITLEEGTEEHRQLSDATKNSDWQDGMFEGEKQIHVDRAIKRALAFGDTIEEFDVLWRDQLLDTVIEGARKNQIARDAANVIPVETSSGDHPRASGPEFAREVAQGGAIRDDREEYDSVSWNTVKFGEGARATDELIDDALISVIERQVQFLGRACENKLNRIWLTELIDNADSNNDVDTSGASNRDIASLNEAIANIEGQDFDPDTTVWHPEYTQTVFDSDNILFAQRLGDDEGIRDRVALPLLGLEGFRGSGGVYDPDGSNTWGFASADEIGAVVYQRDHINIYMYRDIEVKDYDDPIRDLQGVNARMSADATWAQPSAGSRLDF